MVSRFPRTFRLAAPLLAIPLLAMVACSRSPVAPASSNPFGAGQPTFSEAGPTGLGINPTLVAGNPHCADIDTTGTWLEIKVDPPTPGTYPGTGGSVTWTSADGIYANWSATGLVMQAVIVKGGPAANVYAYNPPAASADTHLHSPVNPSGNPAAISHIVFCYLPPPPGTEGCSTGFWKNRSVTTGDWTVAGVNPNAAVSSVFTTPFSAINSTTLYDALSFAGGNGPEGAARNLMRAAVAAYLNAMHPDVAYPLSAGAVVTQVNAALVKGSDNDNQWRARMLALATTLDGYNNGGCPLGATE